jgi:hypothetical protein
MHRAVAARLENPKLTLTEALQAGGFDVLSNEDEHGVTVSQRKNQLSRRLRLVRQSQLNVDQSHPSPNGRERQFQEGENIFSSPTATSLATPSHAVSGTLNDDGDRQSPASVDTSSKAAAADLTSAASAVGYNFQEREKQYAQVQTLRHIQDALHNNTQSHAIGGRSLPNTTKGRMQDILKNHSTVQSDVSHKTENSGAALQNAFSAHHHHQHQKKANMDIAALAGGMAGMNQHALQALLFGRLKARGNSNQNHMNGRPATSSSETDPLHEAIKSGGREDIYKSFVRQQKVLNEYLIKTCYQKGAAAAAASMNSNARSQQTLFASQCLSSATVSALQPPSVITMAEGSSPLPQRQFTTAVGCPSPNGLSNGSQLQNQKKEATSETTHHRKSSNITRNDVRIEMVLTSHQTENASLLQRLMCQAGFTADELLQHSPLYIEISSRAAAQEVERVRRLEESLLTIPGNVGKASKRARSQRNASFDDESGPYHSSKGTELDLRKQNHHHSSVNSSSHGRHVHRLMGKCGHRAIIHRPPNGEPHIDFIVKDRVECYQNVSPEAAPRGGDTLWPSRYECADLECNTNSLDANVSEGRPKCGSREESDRVKDASRMQVPQEFDISILKEWDVDPFEGLGDQTVLGLIELGKHNDAPS